MHVMEVGEIRGSSPSDGEEDRETLILNFVLIHRKFHLKTFSLQKKIPYEKLFKNISSCV